MINWTNISPCIFKQIITTFFGIENFWLEKGGSVLSYTIVILVVYWYPKKSPTKKNFMSLRVVAP